MSPPRGAWGSPSRFSASRSAPTSSGCSPSGRAARPATTRPPPTSTRSSLRSACGRSPARRPSAACARCSSDEAARGAALAPVRCPRPDDRRGALRRRGLVGGGGSAVRDPARLRARRRRAALRLGRAPARWCSSRSRSPRRPRSTTPVARRAAACSSRAPARRAPCGSRRPPGSCSTARAAVALAAPVPVPARLADTCTALAAPPAGAPGGVVLLQGPSGIGRRALAVRPRSARGSSRSGRSGRRPS